MQPEPNVPSEPRHDDPGLLANNGMFVKMLQTALSRSDTNLNTIPGLIRDIIDLGRWLAWLTPDGEEIRWSRADFRRFIEAPRPHGCQTPIPLVRKILAGTEVLPKFEEVIRGTEGAPHGNQNAAGPRVGSLDLGECKSNRDNITDSIAPTDEPDTIPIRTREAPTGTSTSYALRRLRREGKDELLEKVFAGEITPNRAMIEAGLRKPHLQVKDDPDSLAAYLLRKWDRDRIGLLMNALADALESEDGS